MKVVLLRHTPDPEKTCVLAAKLCYSPSNIDELEGKVEGTDHAKFLKKILKLGHHSILEHASFTFGVEGISRTTSHQLVRHRIASYSQQSQRYVTNGSEEYVIPPSIGDNPEKRERFTSAMTDIYKLYWELVDEGVPPEDARYLLPNATATKIIISMNARSLLHFFRLRGCERAQWEIRDMATRMVVLAKEVAPVIFEGAGPACVTTKCSEGEMTCGKPDEIRSKFLNL